MANTGKCPKCEKKLIKVIGEPVKIESGKEKVKGVYYLCPHCKSILSVQIDPLPAYNRIVKKLK